MLSDVAAEVGVPSLAEATMTWSTDEPATTRVNWGETAGLEKPPVIDNIASFSHSAVIGPLTCGTEYFYQAQSTDAVGNIGAVTDPVVARTRRAPAVRSPTTSTRPRSTPVGSSIDPSGTSTVTALPGMVSMSVIGQQRHDLSTVNRSALRLLQSVSDTDFVVRGRLRVGRDVRIADPGRRVRAERGHPRAFRPLQRWGHHTCLRRSPRRRRACRRSPTWRFRAPYRGRCGCHEPVTTGCSSTPPNDGATWQTIHSRDDRPRPRSNGPVRRQRQPAGIGDSRRTPASSTTSGQQSDPIAITDPGTSDGPLYTVFGGEGMSWSGAPLEFGSVGLAQPDVNVQGRVADPDGMQSITYQVNGGQPVLMGLGTTACDVGNSCTRRLANDGDFNADIDASIAVAGSEHGEDPRHRRRLQRVVDRHPGQLHPGRRSGPSSTASTGRASTTSTT